MPPPPPPRSPAPEAEPPRELLTLRARAGTPDIRVFIGAAGGAPGLAPAVPSPRSLTRVKTVELDPQRTETILATLTDPKSYTDQHTLCYDPFMRLIIQTHDQQIDLMVDEHCRHLILEATGEPREYPLQSRCVETLKGVYREVLPGNVRRWGRPRD